VWKWWDKYKAEGVRGIRAKKRGRTVGTNRSLNAEQEFEIQKEVFFATADLFNLEVDLVFFDATSTYIEKDEGPDLPQVVIPVRCWVFPGNTSDMKTVEQGIGRTEGKNSQENCLCPSVSLQHGPLHQAA
jgi:hypothetical protein